MKIYKDRGLTEEINILDLGIVPAGDTEKFIFFVYNDLNAYLTELKFSVENEKNEVKIIDAPKELAPKMVSELIVQWIPSITLKEGLRAKLHIQGQELWS